MLGMIGMSCPGHQLQIGVGVVLAGLAAPDSAHVGFTHPVALSKHSTWLLAVPNFIYQFIAETGICPGGLGIGVAPWQCMGLAFVKLVFWVRPEVAGLYA